METASALPPLYAHRLGRHYGPDSSAAALRHTLTGPVEGLETDVCLTADGRLVLLHDPLLTLGTTLDGWAHQRTAAEIRSALIRDSSGAPTAEHPLLLDELIELVPETVRVQLEVKAHADPALARRTAEALSERLRDEPIRDRVEVISFHGEACALAAAEGISSRLVIWADYAPEALASWALRTGVGGISVEHFLLTQRLVGMMRGAGLSVNAGTVNHPEILSRVLEFAPDAIGTDRPHELRAGARTASALTLSP
ncbi:MAG: glycerophosphodiester phosphodiesterase [Solirubrobacterales bacterium]|nr:glycerophosphodiester phosphodiesterase [Solirubrobacterales bacterium]